MKVKIELFGNLDHEILPVALNSKVNKILAGKTFDFDYLPQIGMAINLDSFLDWPEGEKGQVDEVLMDTETIISNIVIFKDHLLLLIDMAGYKPIAYSRE